MRTRTNSQYSSTMICVTWYAVRTSYRHDIFTAVITPNTCDDCCCFAATVADAGDDALYWCCYIFTAAAVPGAPAAALYSATKIMLLCL